MKNKLLYILGILIILQLTQINTITGASFTWTGNTSSSWTVSGNWSGGGGGIPGSGDNITINSNAPNNLVLDQNRTVANFFINGDTLDLGTYTLTATGVTYFNGGLVNNGNLSISGSLCHFGSGSIIDARIQATCGYYHLNGGLFKKASFLVSTGSASTSGTGNCVFEDTLSITNNGTYYFTMSSITGNEYQGPLIVVNNSTHEVLLASSDTSYFNDILLSNTNGGGITFGSTGGVSYLASGNTISIDTGGFENDYLTLNKFYQLGTTTQNLALTGTAIVNMTSCTFNGSIYIDAPGFLIKYCSFQGTASLRKSGTTSFYSYGGNVFAGTTTIGNYNSSGRIRLASTAGDTFLGDVMFEGAEIQVAYAGINDFYGSIQNYGYTSSDMIFDAGNGTCRLLGSSFQELTGYSQTYRKLIIHQGVSSSRDVFYDGNLTIKDTLQLISGRLIPFPVSTLTMKAGSKVIGGSDSSFVSGPMKKIGNTEFEFPVGKENVYRPLKISAPTTLTHAFTAEYFNDPQPFGENLDTTLAYIDDCSYWNLTRNVGSSEVFVTLSWGSGLCPVKDTTYLKIASWYDDNWNDKGHGTISGNFTSGKMTTTVTNSAFEHFIFAYDLNIVQTIQPDEYITADGFVQNIGQLLGTDSVAHPEILYYGSAFNSNLFLADSVFSYVFSSIDSVYGVDSMKHCVIDSVLRFDMKLNGINRSIEVTASDTSQGYKNYFLGYLDTSYTHALTYQEVKFNEIYDGIDLLFHNNDEFRFALDSSGLSGFIEIYYQGADSVKVDGEGFLNVFTKLGNKKYGLHGFEYVSGEWSGIDVSFQKTDSIITFSLGTVTRNVPLIFSVGPWQFPFPPQVINPHNKLKWCTSYTTSGTYNIDDFYDAYIDNADNVFVIGYTFNPFFPTVLPIQQWLGLPEISVVKFLPNRSRHFATFYGGSSHDVGLAITTDYNGNIIFTGSTSSVDFPQCASCFTPQPTNGGSSDAVIVKLTSDGQNPLLSTYYGLSGFDMAQSLAVDKSNNIYIVGGTTNGVPVPINQPVNSFYSDFTANFNSATTILQDGYIAKFSSTNSLVWATHYGSDGIIGSNNVHEYVASIYFDEDGNNFYIAGVTNCDKVQTCAAPCSTDVSPDFPITGNNYIYDTPDGYDIFIVKFNSSLQVTWSTLWGGDNDDFFGFFGTGSGARVITVSPLNDDFIITGLSNSSNLDLMDIGGSSYFDNSSPGGGFIASFDSNDNLKWCTSFSGFTKSIASNDLGQFIVTGYTDNANMDVVQSNLGAYYQPLINNLSVNNGNIDGFLLKFNSAYELNHATFIGGAQNDYINSSIIQKSNGSNIICVGKTGSPDFPWRDYIPNYIGDYSFGNPGLNTSNFDATPFVFNMYNVSTPLRLANSVQISDGEYHDQNDLVVFPNPFIENVNLRSTDDIVEFVIYDLTGKVVKKKFQLYSKHASIDLSDFSPGIYMLEFRTTKNIKRTKLIKIQ